MDIRIIAAVDKNFALGSKGKMAWYVPQELKLFKQLTMGGVIIMGRVTYESIGRILPGRITIVLSKRPVVFPEYADDAYHVTTLDDAINLAQQLAPEKTIWITGGAQLYVQCMTRVRIINLSHMPFEIENADVFFPKMDKHVWRCVFQQPVWCNGHLLFTHKIYHGTTRVG